MDSNQRERQLVRQPLTLHPRPLARPARFEPQQLADSSMTVLDEHGQRLVKAMERARAEGLAMARAEVDAIVAEHAAATHELVMVTAALSAAVDQLTGRDRDDLSGIEEQTVRFGVELAEHLVGRELTSTDDQLAAAIMRAMTLTPERGAIVLRINPLDREGAGTMLDERPELAGRIEIIADATVERGGCIAVVGPLRIDAQLGPAMERVRVVLQP